MQALSPLAPLFSQNFTLANVGQLPLKRTLEPVLLLILLRTVEFPREGQDFAVEF